MENWTLRRLQSARIVGTPDPLRLHDVLRAARDAVAAQPSAIPAGGPARWQSIGPDNVPGRIGALGISHQDSLVLYAGSAAGGVYKTIDGGAHWTALWAEQESLAIGGLAVAPSNHDVVYAATGEWEDNVSSTPYHHFAGVGVYVTRDGGTTWTLSRLSSAWTAAVAVDPVDPARVFVAGREALHRSRDGGRTWDSAAGLPDGVFRGTISDVVIDPDDPRRVYIGVHRSGVWRSVNGGDAWTKLVIPGVVDANVISPKIALCRRPGRPAFVAVLFADGPAGGTAAIDGVVATSDDGGDTFRRKQSIAAPLYAAWCTTIAVDPTNSSVILAGHVNLSRSTDGGGSWQFVGRKAVPPSAGHSDQQAIVFDPADHQHVYVATDGGVFESRDNGATWRPCNTGLLTTQCYTVALSRSGPFRIAITTQDNGAYQSDGAPSFTEIMDTEGGWVEYDPSDAHTVYVDTRDSPGFLRDLQKSSRDGAADSWVHLGIQSDAAIREAMAIARRNPQRLLVVDAAGRVQRSTTAGASWTQTLTPAGARMCAVEYAVNDANWAYAASADGRIWCSTDGGGRWTELPRAGLPQRPVNDIEVDPSNPRRVFLAFGADAVSFGDDTRAVWRGDVTTMTDVTWADISGRTPGGSLPPRLPITALAVHPDTPETLFAAHLLGVHRTADGGQSWARFDEGLPHSFVSDLDVHEPSRTLYLATMGRGLFRWTL